MLTIYALAHDSNSTEDVYISLHDKVKLYIKLTDDLGKTLVEQSVTSLKQAVDALKNYTEIHKNAFTHKMTSVRGKLLSDTHVKHS